MCKYPLAASGLTGSDGPRDLREKMNQSVQLFSDLPLALCVAFRYDIIPIDCC